MLFRRFHHDNAVGVRKEPVLPLKPALHRPFGRKAPRTVPAGQGIEKIRYDPHPRQLFLYLHRRNDGVYLRVNRNHRVDVFVYAEPVCRPEDPPAVPARYKRPRRNAEKQRRPVRQCRKKRKQLFRRPRRPLSPRGKPVIKPRSVRHDRDTVRKRHPAGLAVCRGKHTETAFFKFFSRRRGTYPVSRAAFGHDEKAVFHSRSSPARRTQGRK